MATQTPNRPQAERTTDEVKQTADQTADRIRDLNERIIDSGRKAGSAYLDTYEKTLNTVADYQDRVAKQTDIDWISTIVGAQADFTREIAKLQTSTARELLK